MAVAKRFAIPSTSMYQESGTDIDIHRDTTRRKWMQTGANGDPSRLNDDEGLHENTSKVVSYAQLDPDDTTTLRIPSSLKKSQHVQFDYEMKLI